MSFTTKQIALVYTTKPSCILSILGSSFIAYDVVRNSKENRGRRLSVNQLLLLIMSIADIIASIGFFLGPWPIPESLSHIFYGASGTTATCTAQGFVLLFAVPCVFVGNACLNVSCLLMIRYNWSEEKLQRLALPWFLFSILLVGSIEAFTALFMDLINGNP